MPQTRLSISVALCTYNGGKYLPEQLASIAAQTRLPEEMVVCDDGSTDATPRVIEEFARTAPFPVRSISNPKNLGSTKNFEKAISLCRGDSIALCDQDDVWMPEKLARQAEMMERDPDLGGVFSDAELVDENSQPLGIRLWNGINFTPDEQQKFKQGEEVPILLKRNVVTGATLMMRANLRPLITPIPAAWVHDGWIAWMSALYSRIRMMEAPLVRYRIHASQQVGLGTLEANLPPTFWERLQKGKREEPEKYLARATELKHLEQWLAKRKDARSAAILPSLRRTIRFYEDRGRQYESRSAHLATILRNAHNYPRYENGNGLKCLVREMIIACL
ncbi:MAG: glycosyltransferase family 2 protein [Acidobacteriota bacterium]